MLRAQPATLSATIFSVQEIPKNIHELLFYYTSTLHHPSFCFTANVDSANISSPDIISPISSTSSSSLPLNAMPLKLVPFQVIHQGELITWLGILTPEELQIIDTENETVVTRITKKEFLSFSISDTKEGDLQQLDSLLFSELVCLQTPEGKTLFILGTSLGKVSLYEMLPPVRRWTCQLKFIKMFQMEKVPILVMAACYFQSRCWIAMANEKGRLHIQTFDGISDSLQEAELVSEQFEKQQLQEETKLYYSVLKWQTVSSSFMLLVAGTSTGMLQIYGIPQLRLLATIEDRPLPICCLDTIQEAGILKIIHFQPDGVATFSSFTIDNEGTIHLLQVRSILTPCFCPIQTRLLASNNLEMDNIKAATLCYNQPSVFIVSNPCDSKAS